ncbi:MAG: hypothetical protein ACI35O_11980 [Bacillaceae bacterium]
MEKADVRLSVLSTIEELHETKKKTKYKVGNKVMYTFSFNENFGFYLYPSPGLRILIIREKGRMVAKMVFGRFPEWVVFKEEEIEEKQMDSIVREYFAIAKENNFFAENERVQQLIRDKYSVFYY